MKMLMTITPVENINYEKKIVINKNDIDQKLYDWKENVFVYNVKNNRFYQQKVSNINIFDERLIIGNKQYHICEVYSKNYL